MGDMMQPDRAEESPIGKVESKTAELKTMASDVLELSMGIEDFLRGATPIAASEEAEKKSPSGWLEVHWEHLDNIKSTLSLALNCLRAVKGIVK